MKRLIANLTLVLVFLYCTALSHAASLREARVTQVVSDVKLLPERAQPRPASVDDMVRDGTAVRTGTQSRSELTFPDRTMTRLGQNTIFSFRGEPAPPAEGPADLSFEAPAHLTRSAPSSRATGNRVMHLDEGAMLFQVPKGTGGATIQSPVVTAAVTGTTGIGESHAASETNPKPIAKWFCLEGHIIVKLNDGSNRSVQLSAGQMVVTDGTTLPQPRYFDIAALVNTSPLFNPRPASWDLIQQEMQNQLDERIAGTFVDSTRMASLDPNTMAGTIDQAMRAQETPSPTSTSPTPTPTTPTPTPTTPTPTPTTPTPTPPSKFGALAVINSPDPFVIDGSTVINTDPTITRALATDLGKIYRSSGMDGSRTVWLFGSTSAFDNASGFDHGAASSFLNNIAGFKFQNLILESDPTIDTTSGVTNLALVGVNGITTGSFPSTFTFAGIDTLLLATQSGSIDLMSDYTFDGPSRIFIYARGAGSHLTIGSTISADTDLHLFSEGAVTISGALRPRISARFSNGDFKNVSGVVTANDFSVTSQAGNINITSDSFRPGSSHISLSLIAGGAIAIRMGSDLSLFASADSISLAGSGINFRTKVGVLTLNLNVLSPATFTAGAGGIHAPSINFMTTGGLELRSDGDIDIHGADIPLVNGHRTISGIIDAGGDFHAVSNVTTGAMTSER